MYSVKASCNYIGLSKIKRGGGGGVAGGGEREERNNSFCFLSDYGSNTSQFKKKKKVEKSIKKERKTPNHNI